LRDDGASVVALDVIFAESDRYDQSSSAEASTSPDAALADIIRQGHVILGYGLTFDKGARGRSACVLHPINLPIVQPASEAGHEPFFVATGAVCNIATLAGAAGASGFLNAAPDADGILRRAPLLAELDGRVYPGLALAAVSAATGAHDLALRIANVNTAVLSADNASIPVDGRSNLLLRYRGKKGTFPYLSAADVMNGEIDGTALRDKIVLVGTTALGTREVVATPLDTLFAGVEVQATVADNLLRRDFLHRSAFGTTIEGLLALLVGLALAALAGGLGISASIAGAAAGMIAVWYGSVSLASTSGLMLSPLYPMIAAVTTVAVVTLAKFTVERGRAEQAIGDKTTAQRLMVQALLSLTEVRDAETGRHSRRTQEYARLLAEQLATLPSFRSYLTRERIELLSSLAPLHDIGKVGVPDSVLNKPGALTPEELAEMRKHPVFGREVILKAEARAGVRDDTTLEMAKDIVYTHHERWDGSGYPQGLRGDAIPVAGRVMALVDVYDAVRARALYKQCLSHEDTVTFIVKGKNTHFDPVVVDAFLSVAERFRNISEREG
jgi:adenylate cyclase